MVITRKKRKNIRKKKYNFWLYFKKIIKFLLLFLLLHIVFVNWKILFSGVYNSDLLVITWDNKQNSLNISENFENKITKSIELFKNNSAKKILILWEKNNFKIDEVELIKNKISQNDIWEGNIAYQNSSILNYPKNTKLFLNNNQWSKIIFVSDFWEYHKNNFLYSQKIWEKNIQIIPIYSSILNSISWIFTNYYYYWKI